MAEIKLDLGQLNQKQEEFIESTARYTAYGGARGGGKTHGIRIKAVLGAVNYPGIRILILRRTYQDLQGNHIEPMQKLVPPQLATYNVQLHQMYFTNGSVIKFGHFNSYTSAFREYQGQEYDWIFMDEGTQFTEEEFRLMGGCNRGVNNIPKQMFITCNPGGVGHRWVKRLFIDRNFRTDSANPEENENPEDYYFIQATVDDNTALLSSKDGDAYKKMLSSLPENIRAAHRYGDWDVLSGNYFPEFSIGKHVIAPFKIPSHWTRYRSFDYGLDMLAVVWAAVDEKGRAYIYRELRQSNLNVSEAAQAILDNTGRDERISVTFAPPDMWNRQKDSGKSMAELFMVNGVPIIKADNNRVQGWLQVKEFLMDGEDGRPGLVLFNGCKGLIEDIQNIQTDEKNPNDCAKQPHDITHGPDSLRYFCVSRTLPSELPVAETYRDEFDEENAEDEMTGGEISTGYINA